MKHNFEHILLSILLGTSTLLGLAFWLNINYGFNLFYREHWNELAKLQASQTPICHGFYISIIIAILIFVIGIYAIYHPKTTKQQKIPGDTKNDIKDIEYTPKKSQSVPNTQIQMSRPPRLNLPNNMANIVAQKQLSTQSTQNTTQNLYTPIISKIFSENGYLVKPNPKISGFTPDLFAIGPNEVLWIGATDTQPEYMQRAIEKLQSVFTETLEDIRINIKAFILDTKNQHQPTDSILIFKSIDELKTFVSKNPADTLTDTERENFDAYSEYIDTIIQYIKNI